MKKIIVITVFSLLVSSLFIENIYSQQDVTAGRYFPLNVGNFYVYEHDIGNTPVEIVNFRIQDSTIVEGKLYFRFHGIMEGYFRYDSLTGNILRYDSTFTCSFYLHNKILDSLWASAGNYLRGCSYPSGDYMCTQSNANISVLGLQTFQKGYYGGNLFNYVGHYYAKDIGLFQVIYNTRFITENYILKGCVIKGIIYGDTTQSLTAITRDESNVKSFSLHQNYPNPFNPTTKIKFDVPTGGNSRDHSVRLIIYDILGRQVATLVNEQLKPGSYEVDWDGSNYASGIYFYQLITNQFTETKRMVLLK